jgi:type I restriction enzyme S subunit
LNALNHQIDAAAEKLSHVEKLKKALMQDLLTGKVRVNVAEKEKEKEKKPVVA